MNKVPLSITFLGTGTSSGVPMVGCDCSICTSTNKKDTRLRSSILVESATTSFVIDTTPDFRYQMLRTNTKHIDAVVFTHPHKDHIGGLDDIRPFNFFSKVPMNVYTNKQTLEALKREFYYIFEDKKYPGVPDINVHIIDDNPFYVGNVLLEPILLWHLNMQVYGFRMGDFTYVTDANRIDIVEKEKIKGSKVLVLNALRREKHISHFTFDEAIELALELEVPEVYLTHISHQLGLYEDVNKELPSHIRLAYDGLTLKI